MLQRQICQQKNLQDVYNINHNDADILLKWRIGSRTSTEGSGKKKKKKIPTGLQVHLEDMF